MEKSRHIPTQESAKLSFGEAMSQVFSIEQMVMRMGANDYEPSAFNGIKKQLEHKEISPEEAIRQAQYILDSKQDYH